jgi:hypothetical protein
MKTHQQLGRAVFRILRCLLGPNLAAFQAPRTLQRHARPRMWKNTKRPATRGGKATPRQRSGAQAKHTGEQVQRRGSLPQVPDMEPSVCARGGQDGLVVWAPLHLEDFTGVVFKGTEPLLQAAQVPKGHGLRNVVCPRPKSTPAARCQTPTNTGERARGGRGVRKRVRDQPGQRTQLPIGIRKTG